MNRPAPWRSIMASVVDRRPFRVGGATVDPVSRDASWRGGQERLQPQTLKVLETLVSRRGDVVTRDELVQLCWDGRFVGDDVINRSISILRHFAERAGGFEIETVPRTGYRLIEKDLPGRRRIKARWLAGGVAAAVLAAGVGGLAWLGRPASQGRPPTPSISVVPFTTEAGDALAVQVAQAAPDSLEQMMAASGFAIIRANAAGKQAAGTDYVFTGNVRRTATSIDATVKLVSTRDGSVTFAHDFTAPIDRATDLPDRIGATIAAELAWTGAQMALDPNEHLNPEITSELMNAIVLTIEDHDDLRAYQLTRHAAVLAPNSAFAQLSLAVQTGFSTSSIPPGERAEAVALGRRAGERARTLAPEFGDVYLTWCLLHSPVRMSECDARVHRALQVDFMSSFVPGYLSSLFDDAGRIDEAVELARQSIANDPYKPAKMARMIRMLEVSGRSDEAEQLYREAQRLWPDSGRMRAARLLGMAEAGNYAKLAAFVDPKADADMLDPVPLADLLVARRKHELGPAQHACGAKGLKRFTQSVCMAVLADLGDRDGAFAIAAAIYPGWRAPAGTSEDRLWLDHPSGFANPMLTGPATRALRTDPRYLDMAQQLGLADYWRKARLPDFCRPPDPEPVCSRLGKYH